MINILKDVVNATPSIIQLDFVSSVLIKSACGGKEAQRRPTSELRDEGHHAVLLEDPLQFGLHVLIHVGFKRVLEQDPSS